MNITDMPRLSKEDEIELAKRIEAGVYAAHLVQEQASETTGKGSNSQDSTTGSVGVRRDELLQVVRDGQEAWARFFTANMPLVIHMAAGWNSVGQQLSMEDRVQQGSVALLKAMAAWDHTRGVSFGAFARMHLVAATRPTFAPTEIPLPDELPLAATCTCAFPPSPKRTLGSQGDILRAAWEHLSTWQRQILALRFGLGGGEPCSYTSMAERLGVSYREARRMERSAFSELAECSMAERYAYAAV